MSAPRDSFSMAMSPQLSPILPLSPITLIDAELPTPLAPPSSPWTLEELPREHIITENSNESSSHAAPAESPLADVVLRSASFNESSSPGASDDSPRAAIVPRTASFNELLLGRFLVSIVEALERADPLVHCDDYTAYIAQLFGSPTSWRARLVERAVEPALAVTFVLDRMLHAAKDCRDIEHLLTVLRMAVPSLALAIHHYGKHKERMVTRFEGLPAGLQDAAMSLLPALQNFDQLDYMLANLIAEFSDGIQDVLELKAIEKGAETTLQRCLFMLDEAADALWMDESEPTFMTQIVNQLTGKRNKVAPIVDAATIGCNVREPKCSRFGGTRADWRKTVSFTDGEFYGCMNEQYEEQEAKQERLHQARRAREEGRKATLGPRDTKREQKTLKWVKAWFKQLGK